MKIYGIAGKARSGKDTVAEIIVKNHKDKKIITYPITKDLKEYAMKLSNWDGKDETKPRDLLQTLGKQIKEKYPDFFIKRTEEDIKLLSKYCDIIIITGLRLIRELEFLKNNYDSTLIKVETSNDNGLTEKQKNDITEQEVDKFTNYDYIIDNNQNKENLENIIKNTIKEWRKWILKIYI